jgi:hypothetical protein
MTKTTLTISPDNVAAMLAGEYDDPDLAGDVLAAVCTAVIARGDSPTAGLVERLPVVIRAWDDGSSEETTCDHGDNYAAAAEELWNGADYGDGDYRVTVSWEATDAAGMEIDSGSFVLEGHTTEPECPEADEHDWTAEFEGGCRENPGVWSTGGTSMLFTCRCRCCGMERRTHTTGPQRNPGECDTTTYSEPDAEWVAEHIDAE